MPPNLREAFTTRLGPLPAWAWGLMLGGAIVAWRVLRDRGADDLEESEPGAEGAVDEFGNEIVTGTASGYGDFTLSPSPMGGGTFAVAPAVTPTEQEPPAGDGDEFNTNFQWAQAAIAWLADPEGGGLPGTVANDSISRWLEGATVTDQQATAVNAAIRQLGPPPETAPSINRQPAPPTQSPSTPAVRAPGRPGNLRFGAVNRTRANVGWNAPTETGGANVTAYHVQRESQSRPGVWLNVGQFSASGTSMPVTAGQRWRFRVRARNSAGWGPYAVSGYVSTPAAAGQPQAPQGQPQPPQGAPQRPLPSVPRNVRGTASTQTQGHVRIIWQAPATGAPFTGYEAYVHRGGQAIRLPIAGTSSADARGLVSGTSYAFQVRARNARGWGPFATINVTAR